MISLILFVIAIVFTIIHSLVRHRETSVVEIFLSYLIFFNIGFMGLIAFCGHIFQPNRIADLIGWAPGNPFQSEVGVANLAFGILGILSLYFRGLFWLATVLGASIFLLGDFIVHIAQYMQGDIAPYNIGLLIWFGDLFVPILALFLLVHYFRRQQIVIY